MENQDSCLSILELFKRYVQNGSFGKTSPAFYRAEKGMISDFCSTPLRNSGIVSHGEYWTRNTLEYPSNVEECSLSDVLEMGGGPAEVLFECESLLGNTQAGGKVRETAARADEEGLTSSSYILNVRGDTHSKGGCGALIHRDISPALACSRQPTLFCRASTAAKAECYENLSPTLTAHNSVVAPFISFNPPRHLMPIECERIQGFPDNWTNVPGPNGKLLSNTRRYKMIGNSMAVPVMRWIGKRILMVENNANSKAKM